MNVSKTLKEESTRKNLYYTLLQTTFAHSVALNTYVFLVLLFVDEDEEEEEEEEVVAASVDSGLVVLVFLRLPP